MGMTREELKEHCEKQIEMCEFWAIGKGEKPSGKVYEEHKLILELLEQETVFDKVRVEIENHCGLTKENHCRYCSYCNSVMGVREILEIIDKYKTKTEVKNDNIFNRQRD